MRDFLPADVRKREYVIGIIKEVYESYGFEPLETPAVENIETLTGKYGEEGNQLIFKILKRGEKLDQSLETRDESRSVSGLPSPVSRLSDLALRYDLTVPLARVVANNKNNLPKFFKRYQIQPVWRADRPARGRFREFYQCDVDAIGSKSMVVEAELISAVSEVLMRLGFEDFEIRLNHRELLREILNKAGVEPGKHLDALTALDKIDKVGREGVERDFAEKGLSNQAMSLLAFLEFFLRDKNKKYIDDGVRSELLDFFKQISAIERTKIGFVLMPGSANTFETRIGEDDSPPDANDWLENHLRTKRKEHIRNLLRLGKVADYIGSKYAHVDAAHPGLRDLFEILYASGTDRLRIDPSLARGLSYYTGTIMEINVDGIGSLGGGGRYDGLIGMFGKEQIPACGFSLGLERILVVMEERGMFPPEIAESTPADVMVTIFSEETTVESLKLASELRERGLRVTVYPEADKLGKQIKYADSIKIPYVCILGETEIAEGKVTVKNIKTGEQQNCARSDAGNLIENL